MLNYKGSLGMLGAVTLLCFALGVMSRIPAFGQDAKTATSDTNAATKTVRALMEERRDVLQQRAEAFEALKNIGQSTPAEVISARNDFLDAELALASDQTQRMDVLNRKLENARQYESLMKARRASARGTMADVLMATAGCLDVEIEIARLQAAE